MLKQTDMEGGEFFFGGVGWGVGPLVFNDSTHPFVTGPPTWVSSFHRPFPSGLEGHIYKIDNLICFFGTQNNGRWRHVGSNRSNTNNNNNYNWNLGNSRLDQESKLDMIKYIYYLPAYSTCHLVTFNLWAIQMNYTHSFPDDHQSRQLRWIGPLHWGSIYIGRCAYERYRSP